MRSLIELILFMEKTLDMNQEMMDALLDAVVFIDRYCVDHSIPLPPQQKKRLNSLSKEIRELSDRMVLHVKEFKIGIDK